MTKRLLVMFSVTLVMFGGANAIAQEVDAQTEESTRSDAARFGVGIASTSLAFDGVSAIFPIEWTRARLEPSFDVNWRRTKYHIPDGTNIADEPLEIQESRLGLGLGLAYHHRVADAEHLAAYFGAEGSGSVGRFQTDYDDQTDSTGVSLLGRGEGTSAGITLGPLFGFEVYALEHLSLGAEAKVLAATRLYESGQGFVFEPDSAVVNGEFKLRYLF